MAMRSGFICILGRPNAGKSTLLNALAGQKLAIVSPKPQTTRNRVQGILNLPARKGQPAAQIILIDTPGVHKGETSLSRMMMREVREALDSCDFVFLIVDATQSFGTGDEYVLELAKQTGTPVFLLLNKIDLIDKRKLLPIIDRYQQMHAFAEILPISAARKDGISELLKVTANALPEGPRYFPSDQVTDLPLRFMVGEAIREQVLMATKEEVPHATSVLIDQFEEGEKLTRIAATIYCEREGQKGILVGKGGQMLKRIGTQARREIERLVDRHVFLELFVKVQPNWRQSNRFVEELDWRRQLEQLAGVSER